MKLSDKEYEEIKDWYCKYRGIKDEGKYWNKSIIIDGKFTHSDEMEVLQDFYESDIISKLHEKILDQIEIIQCQTEIIEELKK